MQRDEYWQAIYKKCGLSRVDELSHAIAARSPEGVLITSKQDQELADLEAKHEAEIGALKSRHERERHDFLNGI